MTNETVEPPVLPIIAQPRGFKYLVGTWSGRILVVNALAFLVMVVARPSSLLLPEPDFIRAFGAKSLADLALGEYWRLFTPMFIHIGAIHFVFNMLGLYYIGYQLEYMLSPKWFILLYLSSGLAGNISSCVFNVNTSAGASGALFGLLGAGFFLESAVNEKLNLVAERRPRRRVYAGMVLLNVILGIFIPVIDNAAHLGGLATGWLFVRALTWLRPNSIGEQKPVRGRLLFFIIGLLMVIGTVYASSPKIVSSRLTRASIESDSIEQAWYYVSDALRVDATSTRALVQAGKVEILVGHANEGLQRIQRAIDLGASSDMIDALERDLDVNGHEDESQAISNMHPSGVSI